MFSDAEILEEFLAQTDAPNTGTADNPHPRGRRVAPHRVPTADDDTWNERGSSYGWNIVRRPRQVR